jgi:hypothetical protein
MQQRKAVRSFSIPDEAVDDTERKPLVVDEERGEGCSEHADNVGLAEPDVAAY